MTTPKHISILGCGWLGYPLAISLLQQGYRVNGSTTSQPKLAVLERAGIEPFLIDLFSQNSNSALEKFLQSDVLIVSYPPRVKKEGAGPYLASVAALCKAIEKSPVKTILFISSTSVYANSNSEVTEDMMPGPESASGEALLKAEELLLSLKEQETIVLRMAGLVGYERHPGRFLAGKKDLTSGWERTNLIHRDDCIGIMTELLKKNNGRDVLNCCSDTHPLKKDFYTQAAEQVKLEPPVFAKGGKKAYKVVSNKKVKELLGYEFIYGDLGRFDWP